MGLAIPRPAMRAREARMIKARMDFYGKRLQELGGENDPKGRAQAFKEAKALMFNRKGEIKEQ